MHQFPVAAVLAGDEDAELSAVASGDIELGVGQRLMQLGQAAVLIDETIDGCAVHSHLSAFKTR